MRHCDSDRFELLFLAAAVVDAESLDAEPTADSPKGASTLSEKSKLAQTVSQNLRGR